MSARFRDRSEAGRRLGRRLASRADLPGAVILGLPRGGVPVAFEIAVALHAPLDVLVVRKLGAPGQEELAMGAIATGNIIILNDRVIERLRIPSSIIEEAAGRELAELHRRERAYRGCAEPPSVAGKTVVLVDDGIATGATMRVAVRALRQQSPLRIIVAVAVATPFACRLLEQEADEVVSLIESDDFRGVGDWFDDFSQTSDEEVTSLLERARSRPSGPSARNPGLPSAHSSNMIPK